MSAEAEQAALGYFLAWLESHQDDPKVMAPQVRSFGAIRNEGGGIHSVRVKVFDTVLSIRPMQPPPYKQETVPDDAHAQASSIRPVAEAVAEQVEKAIQSRRSPQFANYDGCEGYKCPSCGAGSYVLCKTTTGRTKPSPHSARLRMVP